jgi:hypothetical protein
MENRDTQWVDKIDAARFSQFLIFPLPTDEKAYVDYMAKVKALFPRGELRTVHAGGREFLTGPIADLRFLFPNDVVTSEEYTARDEKRPGVYSR